MTSGKSLSFKITKASSSMTLVALNLAL
ncbi:hypothetical protein ID866_8662 [Astraeus odoratus]|nr:hypothetical protein ID866_8662 [Astraeus odoratus]